MRYSILATVLPLAAAVPTDIVKRQAQAPSQGDLQVVQLAHYLENLEYTFYQGGCDNYTDADFTGAGFPDGFREQICITAGQEATHRDTLASVLTAAGQTPLAACTYSFPYTSPGSFVSLANLITTVGIGAYLGGAAPLMDDPTLLTAAAAILSVEARHNSYIRAGAAAPSFPSPFDTPLPATFALSLAHAFVVSCPQELPNPPFTIFPPLMLTSPSNSSAPPSADAIRTPLAADTTLTFQWDSSAFLTQVDPNAPLYIAFINQVSEPVFEQLTITGTGTGTVPLPSNLANSAFAVLTNSSGGLNVTQLAATGTLAGPQEIVVS